MRKYLLLSILAVLLTSVSFAQSQYKIAFSYDSAGNQILRDRVCINCSGKTQEIDSTLISNIKEIQELVEEEDNESNETTLIAYPNPVTDILKVEWQASPTKTVEQITLFSTNNVTIYNQKITAVQNTIDLNFSSFSAGMYIALILYSDGSKQSFQILKN